MKPKPFLLPEVPPEQRKPWPWELVENMIAEVVNPVVNPVSPGNAVLDTKTGILAVSLGALQNAAKTKALARDQGMRTLSAVYAPVDKMMEMRRMAAPAARFLSHEIKRESLKVNLPKFTPKLPTLDLGGSIHTLNGPPLLGFIAEGQVCDPDNLSEEDLAAAGLSAHRRSQGCPHAGAVDERT